ncbi:MAG: hypothetical protein ACR2QS_04160 [Woeseiaceae bacterium]
MLPMLRNTTLVLLFFILFSDTTYADAYADARAEVIAAYQAEDYAAMQVAAEKATQARPGYHGALFNLAFAKALSEDFEGALDIFEGLVATGVDYAIVEMEEFAALQDLPGWPEYQARVKELLEPVGEASVAYQFPAGDFIPEGIALFGNDLLLGSIRYGNIERIGREPATLSTPEDSGHWSVFGMRIGPDGGLWYASAAVPEYADVNQVNAGLTGLFRYDFHSGETTVRTVLPKGDAAMVLGDLVFADDDTIYATESLTGALYHYSLSKNEFTQVVAPGRLRSMQGLVLDSSGEYLYVADYVGGLFRVRLDDYSVERVTADGSINLFGIDGLYRYGNELIAIQNGIRPNRVAAFTLGKDGVSVTSARVLARNLPQFDEPTLGIVAGDEFLFVANSHWNRFDREANLPEDLEGPIVLRLAL